jgi:hypothetical protein
MSTIFRMACTTLFCAAAAAHAGTVEVSFDPAAAFADAGESRSERAANVGALADHLRSLGARLPGSDQVLRVQLLDVDLAGSVRPVGRSAQMLRIVRGSADWPQLRLRYTLLEGDRELRSGEETLSDLNYTWRGAAYGGSSSDPLRYEKRLVSDWFEARFLSPKSEPQ